MLKQLCLAGTIMLASAGVSLADGIPVPKERRAVRVKEVHVKRIVRPRLTPTCIEKGPPVYGAEPILLCAPQLVLLPPYDLGVSQELNTITTRSRPPYDQLFAWRYGPGRLPVRSALPPW